MDSTIHSAAPRRIILDVDPGIDDALAIALAFRSPELLVEAITTVAGNVPLEVGTENALKLVELCDRGDTPVAMGARRPLARRLVTAEFVHGRDGLGGVELPEPRIRPDPRAAVDLIIETVNARPGKVTLVAVAPLTNVATALLREPALGRRLQEIILMGGALAGGNATPVAEFNIYTDAEAAQTVFSSGANITMLPLEATAQARLRRPHLQLLRPARTELTRAVAKMAAYYVAFAEEHGRPGASLHDPLAVGLAIDRRFAIETAPMHVAVETKGELTYGQTVANRSLVVRRRIDMGDHDRVGPPERISANAAVPVRIDGERFLDLFLKRLAGGR